MDAGAAEKIGSAVEAGPETSEMTLLVRDLGGSSFEVTVEIADTVAEVKNAIYEMEGILPELQQLIFKKQLLESHVPLAGLDLKEGSALTLLKLTQLPDMTDWEPRYERWVGPCVCRGSDLYTAAGTNNLGEVRSLLNSGQEVNSSQTDDNESPLHHASRLGCLDTAMLLLARGADANAQNSYGNTVLQFACFRHPYDEVVANTTGLDDADQYVQSVSAAQQNKRAMLVLMILGGADVMAGGHNGCTAIQRLEESHEDKVAISILQDWKAIFENGLGSQESVSRLLEETPALKPALPALNMLLQRNGNGGFEWAAQMSAWQTNGSNACDLYYFFSRVGFCYPAE